jgi:hypothetical protein
MQPQGKMAVLWEILQQGSVSGDSFIKIGFEEEYQDPAGNYHPARIRIIPLNSAFVFPEYYPHDYTRMLRCKIKYRFWATAAEGTRQVFTYTELYTEDAHQEFINDELFNSEENPLGVVPIVHIANTKVPSSPWGLSDIQDIVDLNRQYNETATEITDIVNYYSSPVTIVTGAKVPDLQRGVRKVWAVPNDKAKIENLDLGVDLDGPLKFLELIKEKMHEISGIPVNAFGQELAISNTSGVALQITLLPLMQKFRQKKIQYESGFVMLNELVLRAVAYYMPELLVVDPERDPPLDEDQLQVLSPQDPLTYRSTAEFASPLPIDMLIALNEIQMKMALGLESKRGALKILGESFPQEKLEELFDELAQDMLEQGALDLQQAQIYALIQMLTGVPMQPGGQQGSTGPQSGSGASQQPGVSSAGGPQVNTASGAQSVTPGFLQQASTKGLLSELTTISQGTKIPQIRNPLKSPD